MQTAFSHTIILEIGFLLTVEYHSVCSVYSDTGAHTNTIEGNWKGAKENIPVRSRTAQLIPAQLNKIMIKCISASDLSEYILNIIF